VATAPAGRVTNHPVRKVRTAQGTVLDNVQAKQFDGKCNRKIPPGQSAVGSQQSAVKMDCLTAYCPLPTADCSGKGEMVR